jgi:hypothetical protein
MHPRLGPSVSFGVARTVASFASRPSSQERKCKTKCKKLTCLVELFELKHDER